MRINSLSALMGVLIFTAPAAFAATPQPAPASAPPAARHEAEKLARLPPVVPKAGTIDQSGRKQQGRASFYAQHFTHRKMANGNRYDPNSNSAASKSLPLGTTARVTNLENGRSALVKVEDRGPHVRGRVVDLTPKVAEQLHMKKAGVAPVVVAPVAVPLPDGAVKLGAGAAEADPEEVAAATRLAQNAAR